jgi:hypothetical protein
MQTVISFRASAIPPAQLSGIVADYLALEHARVLRRRLVIRYGLIALGAALAGLVLRRLSPLAPWLVSGLFLIPPAWAWIAELGVERRLSRRLDAVDRDVTIHSRPQPVVAAHKKAINSS